MKNDNGIEFLEISEDEFKEYCDSQFNGSEEYENNHRLQGLLEILSSGSYNLKKATSIIGRIEKEIKVYNEFSSVKLSNELLLHTKRAWESISKFASKTMVVKDDNNFLIKENDLLMNSKDIAIDKIDDGYHIVLPVRIPHRKMASFIPDYAGSYRMPIYNALKKAFPNRRPLFLNKCNILIVHHFNNEEDMIDYDNFDYTHLLNCLASFFLTDDSPKYYRLSIDGEVDGKDFTEIYLKS